MSDFLFDEEGRRKINPWRPMTLVIQFRLINTLYGLTPDRQTVTYQIRYLIAIHAICLIFLLMLIPLLIYPYKHA